MKNTGRSRFIASQGGLPVVLYPTDQFPTIASIPTGAVVFDTTDGVVKKKVGGYLVDIQYNVIGYGPIADAPVASEALRGSYFIQTDDVAWPSGRLWLYRRGLQNAGVDGVVLPEALSDIIKASSKFTIVQFCTVLSTNITQFVMAKGVANGDLKEVGLLVYSDMFYGHIGGARITLPASTGQVKFILSNNLTSFTLRANGASVSGVPGVKTSVDPVMLFRVSDTWSPASFKCYGFDVYSGANADGSTDGLALAYSWRLDEPVGSTQVIDSVSGLVGTVTDASPTGFVGVPMLVPDQW